MVVRLEALDGITPDPAGRAVGIVELGVIQFECRQFTEQVVELPVGHDRVGVGVVRAVRLFEQAAKLGDTGCWIWRLGHSAILSRDAGR